MKEVSSRPVKGVLEAARARGIATAPLVEGLFRPEQIDDGSWRFDWPDFVAFMDRLQAACGGPDELAELLETFPPKYPHLGAIVGLFVEPQDFYRFMNASVAPTLYTCEEMLHEPLSDTSYRYTVRILPGYAPCAPMMHASTGLLRAQPVWLGLPKSKVHAQVTDRGGVWIVESTPSRSVPSRLRRATSGYFAAGGLRAEIERNLVELRARYDELRAVDVAAARRDARTGRGHVPSRDATARLEQLQAAWSLTARQAEVLAVLATGRANKEIAEELGCSSRTVEVHVAQILRKAGVDGRASLIALFWAAADDHREPDGGPRGP